MEHEKDAAERAALLRRRLQRFEQAKAEAGADNAGDDAKDEATEKSSVQQQYDDVAPDYEEKWQLYIRLTVEAFMQRTGPLEYGGDTAKVLDVGTGTGCLVRALHERWPRRRHTGVDISKEMLHAAREAAPKCTFVHGTAEALPFPDASFDAAVSLSSLHFWSDPAAGLREIARVLRPGGVLVLSDWRALPTYHPAGTTTCECTCRPVPRGRCHDFVACRLCSWWLYLTPGHSRADWAILGSRAVRDMLGDAGFEAIEARARTAAPPRPPAPRAAPGLVTADSTVLLRCSRRTRTRSMRISSAAAGCRAGA